MPMRTTGEPFPVQTKQREAAFCRIMLKHIYNNSVPYWWDKTNEQILIC
jgi:hypothetical protein